MRLPPVIFALGALVALGACGSDGEELPPLSDATELRCPAPGAPLPFRLDSDGFAAGNAEIAAAKPRDKGEASDTIGNPGGLLANVYLADDASPSAAFELRGAKGKTAAINGLFTTPLAGEAVALWEYDDGLGSWRAVGREITDADGFYVHAGDPSPDGRPVYAVLEADGSCAEHFTYRWPAATPVVITDIDGTLTLSDNELFEEVADPSYVQKTKLAAVELLQTWAAKGYPIIYMTARPHVFRIETRVWLRDLGFPPGPLITANNPGDASAYKTLWLERMVDSFGWLPVAAYGNASTDISAYANAGIPKDITFIIGELAGSEGTVAIPGDDYTDHIADFVTPQPDR